MNKQATGRANAPGASLFGRQLCPQCAHLLVAPDASQHVCEQTVRHIWSCEACGNEFKTIVRFGRPEFPQSIAAA